MEKFFCILSILVGYVPLLSAQTNANEKSDTIKESSASAHTLQELEVRGKSKVERIREGALNVTAMDIQQLVKTSATLGDIINRAPGVRVRSEGGKGSDFELSLNGMSGNSIRYFIDGIPLETKGTGFDISNYPTNLIDHIEIYKGVVPSWIGADAL